jgi:hypothetical protein
VSGRVGRKHFIALATAGDFTTAFMIAPWEIESRWLAESRARVRVRIAGEWVEGFGTNPTEAMRALGHALQETRHE